MRIPRIAAIVLLLTAAAFAQTTTTYNVTASVYGRYTYPFRAFSIPLDQGASIPWLQVAGQSATQYTCGAGGLGDLVGVGFIFLDGTVVNEGGPQVCVNLATAGTDVTFSGTTPSGRPFTGDFLYAYRTYRCGGSGRGSYGTCFQITGGVLTITE